MHFGACLGAAAALLPLAAAPAGSLPPAGAVACLVASVACMGLNYSGFHSYVTDVAPRDAGLVLGITNSCGIAAGIVGTAAAGVLASSAGGFRTVFQVTVCLNVASVALWAVAAKGRPLNIVTR